MKAFSDEIELVIINCDLRLSESLKKTQKKHTIFEKILKHDRCLLSFKIIIIL